MTQPGPVTQGEPASPPVGPAQPVGAPPVGPTQPARPDGPVAEPRRRLHPLTPLLRGGNILMAVVAAISWQGFNQLGFGRWLITLAIALVLALGVSAVSWAVTGYQIRGRELRVHEGLLWRRTRAIPLERVQAVDVVRPLLARLAGLAELRLEVIGASKTEAPLAYLSMGDAVRLRERLLTLAGPVAAPAPAVGAPHPGGLVTVAGPGFAAPGLAAPGSAAPGSAGPAGAGAVRAGQPPVVGRPLHAVHNRDVLVSQLMTPQSWFVPIGLIFVAINYASNPAWTFIGIASFLTALVGVVQVPVRRILDDWHFHLWIDRSGLRLRHGLLDTRNQTVPPPRVQAVSVVRPLLWRPFGWSRSRMDVAGYGGGAAAIRAGVLLPVADAPTTRRVVGEVLGVAIHGATVADAGPVPTLDLTTLPLVAPPARARWLAPVALRYLGFALTDQVVAARSGVVTQRLVVVPLARVQSVRVVQGPVQRRLGLASVHVDTAGGMHVTAEHRTVDEAFALAITVADRSRAVRRRAAAS